MKRPLIAPLVGLTMLLLSGSAIAQPVDICADLSFTYNYAGSDCCWNVIANNGAGDGLPARIDLTAVLPTTYTSIVAGGDYGIFGLTPTNALLAPLSGTLPVGASLVATVCVDPGGVIPQEVIATFLLPDGSCEETLYFDCPPDTAACQIDADGTCRDECPEGFVCDPNCSGCIEAPTFECRFINNICVDQCPDGLICDPDCQKCIEEPPPDCSLSADGICKDNCPDGLVCDPKCNECIEEPKPDCYFEKNQCIDTCPDGLICDPTCQKCIEEPPPDCALTADGQCKDLCPDGLICDPDCHKCIDEPKPDCYWEKEMCIDDCPEGLVCDPNCRKCEKITWGEVCGYKYRDANGNGQWDWWEPVLEGWQIVLIDANGNATTATTDANGLYCFDHVPEGDYTLAEIAQPGWTQTGPDGGTYSVTVSAGQTVKGYDFGNECCSSLPVATMVDINTGWNQDAGATIPPGNADDDWKVRELNCDSGKPIKKKWNSVNVVATKLWPAPFPQSEWISAVASGGTPTSPGQPPRCWEYRTCFCLANKFENAVLDLDMKADDVLDEVLLNGNTIWTGPGANFGSPEHLTWAPLDGKKGFKKGTNCVSFFVRDSFGVITGFDAAGAVMADKGQCCPKKIKQPKDPIELDPIK